MVSMMRVNYGGYAEYKQEEAYWTLRHVESANRHQCESLYQL
jgi:hypothetical protein